jgi:hypothetical protein
MSQARSRAIDRGGVQPRATRRRPPAEWPTDVLHTSLSLWDRLARRLEPTTPGDWATFTAPQWAEPAWREVAPGISCQLLATDPDQHRVSMLVRLAPGTDYPAHRHGGTEELYMLHGTLRVDEDAFAPGDYRRAPAGTVDRRVWSDTGCTGVLLTSLDDVIL